MGADTDAKVVGERSWLDGDESLVALGTASRESTGQLQPCVHVDRFISLTSACPLGHKFEKPLQSAAGLLANVRAKKTTLIFDLIWAQSGSNYRWEAKSQL